LKTEGDYGANPSQYPLSNPPMLPKLLRSGDFGYKTYGAGKSFHFEGQGTPQDDVGPVEPAPYAFWDEYLRYSQITGVPTAPNQFFASTTPIDDYQCRPAEVPTPRSVPEAGSPYSGIKLACGYDVRTAVELPDNAVARYGAKKLGISQDINEPNSYIRNAQVIPSGEKFFLSLGFYRPHGPARVPANFYDKYPGSSVHVPNYADESLTVESLSAVGCLSLRRKQLRRDFGPQSWTDDTRRWLRGYLASVSYVDELLGSVLDAIDSRIATMPQQRIVTVLYSDHGMYLGRKLGWDKMKLYEHCVRVPLMVWDSANTNTLNEPRKSDELISLVDLYPTIATLANPVAPIQHHGKDFSDFIASPSAPTTDERNVFSTFNFSQRFNQPAQFDDECLSARGLVRTGTNPSQAVLEDSYSVVTNRVERGSEVILRKLRYIVYFDEGLYVSTSGAPLKNFVNEELFDLTNDPEERINLLGDAALADAWVEVACTLRQRIVAEIGSGRTIPAVRRSNYPACT
jgi:hypothetical protein